MNRRRHVVSVLGGIFIFSAFLLMMTAGEAYAQECRLIRIQGGGTSAEIYLEPETVRISKGTCVIWSNWVGAKEVSVVFEEGKKCEDMTEAPTGFKMTAENCYVTSWIALGGTSSLRFTEAGTFNYTASATGDMKAKGVIIVE